MDAKTLLTLEFDKVREKLAALTAFVPSRELALALTPSTNFHTARQWLDETREARLLLETEPHTSIGGGRDIRSLAVSASKGIILIPADLLDIKFTLIAARSLSRQLERAEATYPFLSEIALGLPAPMGLVDAISSTVSDRGEILDTASPKLGQVRGQLRIVHDRLLDKMQKLLNNKAIAPYLQESLVTQRDGRYVIPIKAESRGRVKAVVHDVSSSGATLFVEPIQVVDLNNEYRQLQAEEKEEERRILAELSYRLGQHAAELTAAVNTLAALDLVFAKAKYAEDLEAIQPKLIRFHKPKDGVNPNLTLKLWQARHPLLDQKTVVPIDVETDPETYILLITGPNTGGKTVTLKTVGLLACMAQAGMHIPAAEGSEITMFKNIYADIGDEQSIEQSLSTFSGHITNIIQILDKAGQNTLVILDELGAGTDPQEGAALAQAILTYLVDAGIPTLVATHYPELKAYAHSTPGVVNASMAFDMETLRPTYHLTIGLPGRSNALHIAERLGLRQEIIQFARAKINPRDLKADDLLDEIHRQRDLAQIARAEAEHSRRQAEELRTELANRLENIEDERLAVLAKAQDYAQQEIEDLQEELRKVRRNLAQARQPLDVVDEIETAVETIEEKIEKPKPRKQVTRELPTPVMQRPIRLGDKVKLRTLGQEGVVSSLGEEQAEIMVGNLRVRVDLYDLELIGGQVQEKPRVEIATEAANFRTPSPGVELPLRGLTVDEALERLDHYLDRAYISGLPYARLVHGKGTGKLRDAVRKAVKNHPYVDRFEPGSRNEGGDGVTIVHLVKN
ncbi:MAG: endonuclease MutS2 [Anaerolineales bacterium]|nr:endonuclease MutS2 [Anaerolineales bacterium]